MFVVTNEDVGPVGPDIWAVILERYREALAEHAAKLWPTPADEVLVGEVQRYDPESQRWLTVSVYWPDLGFAMRDRRREADVLAAGRVRPRDGFTFHDRRRAR